MALHRHLFLTALVCLLVVVACSKRKDDAAKETPAPAVPETPPPAPMAPVTPVTPPTPAMPDAWKVVKDLVVAPEDVAAVGRRLGGPLAGLRETTYDVGGKTIQVNTLIAADDKTASALMLRMTGVKPAELLLAKGATLYEFVGAEDAMSEIRAGRAHLEGAP